MQKEIVSGMISVIVPIYNVKPYLEKCIYSILNQSYTNIEVILVDDGSFDGSEEICDEFVLRDDRIRVFHKPNGGTSSARNMGLLHAKGEYIGFVDSDDYILDTMYENLLECMRDDVDITCCGTAVVNSKNSGMRYSTYCSMSHVTKMNRHEAIKEVLHIGAISFSPWDKLYRRELFEGVRFPIGKTCEDLPVIYAILKKSRKIINIAQVKYFYCYRGDSASRKDFYLGRLSYALFSRDILLDIKMNFPDLIEDAEAMYFKNAFSLVLQIEASDNKEEYKSIKQRIILMMKRNYLKIIKNKFLSERQKKEITESIYFNSREVRVMRKAGKENRRAYVQ